MAAECIGAGNEVPVVAPETSPTSGKTSAKMQVAPAEVLAMVGWVLEINKTPVDEDGKNLSWNNPLVWKTFGEVIELIDQYPGKFDGPGFIVHRDPALGDEQIIFVDFDNCVSPKTGNTTEWADRGLELLRSWGCPIADSATRTGFRAFFKGRLPEGANIITNRHGPQDVPEDISKDILDAKPYIKDKDGPNWNGLELYEHNKNVTLYHPIKQGYSGTLPILTPEQVDELINLTTPDNPARAKRQRKPRTKGADGQRGKDADGHNWVPVGSLPKLPLERLVVFAGDDELVESEDGVRPPIIIRPKDGWQWSGSDLVGAHPIKGSSTGQNLRINFKEGTWRYFHDYDGGEVPSGDGWTWLACEMGLVDWLDAGSGCLADAEIVTALKQEAIKRGYFTKEQLGIVDAEGLMAELEANKDVAKDPVFHEKIHKLESTDNIGANKVIKKAAEVQGVSEKTIREAVKKTAKKTLADLVLSTKSEFWHDEEKEPYVTIYNNGHNEHYHLYSKEVKLWITGMVFEVLGTAVGKDELEETLNVLESHAKFKGKMYDTFMRVASYSDTVTYIDLGDAEWQVIKVTPEGWEVLPEAPVKFLRSRETLPLPVPERGGSWDDLRSFINVESDDDWWLFVSVLLQAFWVDGPFVLMELIGSEGSGKSVIQRLVKRLIDPSNSELREPPKNTQDFAIAAKSEHVPSFDNLSGIPKGLADAFCRMSTGATHTTRKLYTNDEEASIQVKSLVLLNGIVPSTESRSDLRSRIAEIRLKSIKEEDRTPEKEIYRRFEIVRPRILGCLLDATVQGLANEAKLSGYPRMADFAEWISRCEPALGLEPGTLVNIYTRRMKELQDNLLETDEVGIALLNYLNSHSSNDKAKAAREKGYPKAIYAGTATELLNKINYFVGGGQHGKDWPRTAKHLSTRLRRLTKPLEDRGFEIAFGKINGERLVIISDCRTKTDQSIKAGDEVPYQDATVDAQDARILVCVHAKNDIRQGPVDARTHRTQDSFIKEKKESNSNRENNRKNLEIPASSASMRPQTPAVTPADNDLGLDAENNSCVHSVQPASTEVQSECELDVKSECEPEDQAELKSLREEAKVFLQSYVHYLIQQYKPELSDEEIKPIVLSLSLPVAEGSKDEQFILENLETFITVIDQVDKVSVWPGKYGVPREHVEKILRYLGFRLSKVIADTWELPLPNGVLWDAADGLLAPDEKVALEKAFSLLEKRGEKITGSTLTREVQRLYRDGVPIGIVEEWLELKGIKRQDGLFKWENLN